MKANPFTAALLLTVFPCLAFAEPKDDVQAALKKLADAENYSWTTTVDMGPDSPFRTGPTEGKTLKNGVSSISFKRGENTTEAFVKDGKSVVKQEGAWKTPEEIAAASEGGGGGGGRGGRFLGAMLRNLKAPAVQAGDLAGKVEKLEEKDGAVTGALNAEAVKSLVTFGGGRRRDGATPPEPKDASGTIKFWIKDGSLAKVETRVKATMSFNGEDRAMDRTTTTEFKEVGSTKLEVPEEVTKKLASEEKPAAESK